ALNLTGLTIGQPYFIRVFSSGNGSAFQGNFSIAVRNKCATLSPPTLSNSSPVCVGGNVQLTNSDALTTYSVTNSTTGAISDLSWISRTLYVSGTGFNASQLSSVLLNLNHTFTGELLIGLTSPSGSIITLSQYYGGNGNDYINTVFSAAATNIIGTAGNSTAPFTGTYRSVDPFSNLTGPADGYWVLRIYDNANGDVGTFQNVTLNFAATPTYSWSGPNGFTSSSNDPIVSSVVAASAGTYTATVNYPNGCSTSATTSVSIAADPTISAQPLSTQTLCVGGTPSSLSVTGADGTPSLTYQWFSNTLNSNSGGTNLGSSNGAQTATYTPSTSVAGTTYYYCTISALGNGCTSISTTTAAVIVNSNPVNPTLSAKTPNTASVCEGTAVSATFIAGTGGVGCADSYEYSTNSGSTWTAYTAGSPIATAGIPNGGTVQIRGVRSNCTAGSGCTTNTPTVLATWTIDGAPTASNAGFDQTNCNTSSFT
ncbi:MAG: proprotein convertase P-domain-containing protein, partial [Flavobacteriales bacterium]